MGGGIKLLGSRVGGVAVSLGVGQLLVGLTYLIAARSMPPAGLGLVATCFALGAIAAVVFDLGLLNYLVRDIAAGTTDIVRARAFIARKRYFCPLILVPSLVACVLIMKDPVDGLVLGAVGMLIWEAQNANSLMRALEKFSKAAVAQVMGRAMGLSITAMSIVFGVRPELALSVGLTTGFAGEIILDLVFLGNRSTDAPVGRRELLSMHRRALSFGLVSLSAAGQQLDAPLVAAGGGPAEAGVYAGAGRLIGPMLFLSSAMAMVGAPWLARARHDPTALRVEERRILRLAAVLTLAPLTAAAIGPWVVPMILGAQYFGSGTAFSVLALGGALSTISQGFATVLQGRGAEHTVGVAISTGLILGLVATFVLATTGDATWAAVGFLLSQAYIVAHLSGTLLLQARRVANDQD